MSKKWYVIQTFSGYENKVKEQLLQRIKDRGKEAMFGELLIPQETVTDVTPAGKQRVRQKNRMPGYIFVEMEMGEDNWHIVKNTPRVTGFIGDQKPREIRANEIELQRRQSVDGAAKPKLRVSFEIGEEIRVVDGAFVNFSGVVEEVMPEKHKVKVKVSIFGRATPLELDYTQVEKLKT